MLEHLQVLADNRVDGAEAPGERDGLRLAEKMRLADRRTSQTDVDASHDVERGLILGDTRQEVSQRVGLEECLREGDEIKSLGRRRRFWPGASIGVDSRW